MTKDCTIFVGTVGGGLSRSPDGGETWVRVRDPLATESNVRALAAYPDNPHRILAGSDNGIFRSGDNGITWEKLDSPMDDLQIWSIGIDPVDSDTIFVGTKPDGFRSRDGGKHWEQLSMGVAQPCVIGVPRITNMIVDPRDHRTIWAGIEVDGVYKSLDGGDNWVHLPDLGDDPFYGDIHGMAIGLGRQTTVYASSPYGITATVDEGESWEVHEFPKYHEGDKWSYCRGMAIKADDPNVIFVGNGDMIPGVTGAVQRSFDGGQSWEPAPLPVEPNSVIYWFATHASVPEVIAAASLYGYIYTSSDGGVSWDKLAKEFGEIRSLALTPN